MKLQKREINIQKGVKMSYIKNIDNAKYLIRNGLSLKSLSYNELVEAITGCDIEIHKLLEITIDENPGALMGLGDFYVEKNILLEELKRRHGK